MTPYQLGHSYNDDYPSLRTKRCLNCGEVYQPTSGNQKYCGREDSPECQDDRYFQKLWDKGRHPLQKEIESLTS